MNNFLSGQYTLERNILHFICHLPHTMTVCFLNLKKKRPTKKKTVIAWNIALRDESTGPRAWRLLLIPRNERKSGHIDTERGSHWENIFTMELLPLIAGAHIPMPTPRNSHRWRNALTSYGGRLLKVTHPDCNSILRAWAPGSAFLTCKAFTQTFGVWAHFKQLIRRLLIKTNLFNSLTL